MLRIPTCSSLFRLALFGLASVTFASTAHATTVRVAPADTTVSIGDNVTLRVMIDDASSLKGYQLIYKYGPVLQYRGSTAGDMLTGSGSPYVVLDTPDHTAPADTAGADCAQLLTSTHGPGVMLYFRFKAQAEGNSLITCQRIDMRDEFNNPVPASCAGGIVRVLGPVPTRRSTWGRVKSAYR